MCNFDLTWAAFRCRYLDSTKVDKEKMIASISMGPDAVSPDAKADADSPVKNGGKTAALKNGAQAKVKGTASSPLVTGRLLKIFALGPWSDNSKTSPVAMKMNQTSEPTK